MVLDKWKTIFIHIPKTAGGSIANALLKEYFNCARMHYSDPRREKLLTLNGRWTQHDSIQETLSQRGMKAKDYFKFCFVRNPWDRAVSEYFYIKSQNGCGCEISDVPNTFEEWIKKGMNCTWEGHGGPQVDFIIDDKGENIMDFIGRFESLSKDVAIIFSKLGITAELQHINLGETRRKNYASYYDSHTKDVIAAKYAKDIEYFGYKFEE